jgi:hypothetical protein
MPADHHSDQESVAKLAYLLWESRGRPAGSAEQDWLEAEALFAASKAAKIAADKNSLAAVPTLDNPAKVHVERAKTERRKSRAKKTTTTRESDGPVPE